MKLIMLLISFIGGIAGYGNPPPPPPPCNTPQCSSGTFCFTNTNQCTVCPSGYIYNANPNVGASSVSLWGCSLCPSGTISTSSGSASCSSCPIGTFSMNLGSTACVPCPANTFASTTGQSSCSPCSSCVSGKYLLNSCTSSSNTVCPSCTSIANCAVIPTCSSAINSQCSSCSSGYYLSSPATCISCKSCFSGLEYEIGACSTNSNRQCATCTTTCPIGQMLSGTCGGTANKICIPCPTGFYKSLADGSACQVCTTRCLPGMELSALCNPSTNSICVTCPTGFYKSLADGSACQACTATCSPGMELNALCSSSINPLCVTCQSGFYKSLADGSACQACTATCSPGMELNTLCSPSINPLCVSCQTGFYKSVADGSACQACNNDCGAGAYLNSLCSSTNNPVCELCPVNTANPNQFSVFKTACLTCPNGAISVAGSATCIQCSIGKATFGNINCSNCKEGTYADTTGSITCKLCPEGTANNQIAANNLNDCQACAAGYISFAGAASCSPCPPGTYNINNECLPCLTGAYNNLIGQTVCFLCPPGTANNVMNAMNINACLICAPGSFASAGATNCSLCSAGTSNNNTGARVCAVNPPGTFTNTLGSVNTTKCPPGYYSENNGSSICTACPPGFINILYGATNINQCIACNPGFFSPFAGSFQCLQTKRGYYQDYPGQYTSIPCLAGTANNNIGSAAFTDCNPCATGKYQPSNGSAECIECPVGYYQNASGQIGCLPCVSGTYNPATGSVNNAACLFCLAGTYSANFAANSSSTCLVTPLGTYTNNSGSTNFSLCEPGTYQNKTNQTACTLCLAGTFNPLAKATNISACQASAPGFYIPIDGYSLPVPCPPGYWSNINGSTSCEPCSPSTFTNKNASTACIPCPSGTFALGFGFAECEAIGIPIIEFNHIYADRMEITVKTNFIASVPMHYSCSANCNIYVNNILISEHATPVANKKIMLLLRLGVDVVSIVFNGTFNSSFTDWICDTSSNCFTIPPNNVILNVELIINRNMDNNPYADFSTVFASIHSYALSQNQAYDFMFFNLEAAVAYSFTVKLPLSYNLGSATTKSAVPTGAVQNLIKYFIGINVLEHANNEQANLQIHWDPPQLLLQHGPIIGYNVSYQQEERTYITSGPNVLSIITPATLFSLFTNDTTLIITNLIPDTVYTITVYPMTDTLELGPGSTIQLKTQVSAPRKPPVLTLISRKATNITVKWDSLSNETGIITKAWIIAEPYDATSFSATSHVVHIPTNTTGLPELPFPHTGIRGFFAEYNVSNPCQSHIVGFTFKSIFSGEICGGFCDVMCEYGTPMLDPTTILPTNDQNLTNDNYLMNFITKDGNISTRFVPYLTMKKRFVINSTNGGLLAFGKIMLGDGKINPNSLLNNTIINPLLSYRIRLIVFTSENLYAISEPLEIPPFQAPSTSDLTAAVYIGICLAIAAIITLIVILICSKKFFKKQAAIKIIHDEFLPKKKNDTYLDVNSNYSAREEPKYFDVSFITKSNVIKTKVSNANAIDANAIDPNAIDPNAIDPNAIDPNAIDANAIDEYLYFDEEIFANPAQVIDQANNEEIFDIPARLIPKKGIMNPTYFTPEIISSAVGITNPTYFTPSTNDVDSYIILHSV